MKPRLYLQLGRAGDILNVLPLLQREAESGARPHILVAEPYLDLLDGVTYAEPHVWRGAFEDTGNAWTRAVEIARDHDLEIVPSQIYGNTVTTDRTASSFVRQSWDQVPGAPPWGTLPLEFDGADLTRAAGVKRMLLKQTGGKPYIVTALAGTSSPFEHAAALRQYLRNKLGKDLAIVDVSGFIAPRLYDLIPLLEGARGLIAVDSAILHLAHACPETNVVAFITREPTRWHGTAWRPQHVARYFYDEAPECFAAIVDGFRDRFYVPSIYQVWSRFGELDDETVRRMDLAHRTWEAERAASGGIWRIDGVEDPEGIRTSKELGDPRPMAYVRDLVDSTMAFAAGNPDNVIALTNADVCLTPGISGWVLEHCARAGCAFTHRWDFKRLDRPLRSESEVVRGEWYPGSDAFFFTVRWWRKHRDEYPDMLIGREQVDEVLRQLIKRHGGLEIHGAVYHEKHEGFWRQGDNREKNPGNQYNRRLARKWFLRTGYGPDDPVWWQIPTPRD